MINIIVAVASNGVIGGGNQLLWHISEDLRHFKAITSGHPVIMGRKTYESLGRPLPNRDNIVITRSDIEIEGCRVVHSLEEALGLYSSDDEVFIIGGAQIYAEAMPLAQRFYLTRVEHDYEGDTLYPEWSAEEWALVSSERFERGAKYEYPFVFEEYHRCATPESSHYIVPAKVADIEQLQAMSLVSFSDTYKDILSSEQLVYMLDLMYSVESLESQFAEGYRYFIYYYEGVAIGYLSILRREDRMIYLDKIYLMPNLKGQGFGRHLIEFAFEESKRICGGACRLELSVNRFNTQAYEFYCHIGMGIACQEDVLLEGTPYYRNDYTMFIELE